MNKTGYNKIVSIVIALSFMTGNMTLTTQVTGRAGDFTSNARMEGIIVEVLPTATPEPFG